MEIKLVKNENPGAFIPDDKLGFGRYFTDHMFIMNYDAPIGWHDARIVPFQNLSIHPASTVLHYGAEIFEGLKAYRTASGDVQLFRPMENIKRMNPTKFILLKLHTINLIKTFVFIKIFIYSHPHS